MRKNTVTIPIGHGQSATFTLPDNVDPNDPGQVRGFTTEAMRHAKIGPFDESVGPTERFVMQAQAKQAASPSAGRRVTKEFLNDVGQQGRTRQMTEHHTGTTALNAAPADIRDYLNRHVFTSNPTMPHDTLMRMADADPSTWDFLLTGYSAQGKAALKFAAQNVLPEMNAADLRRKSGWEKAREILDRLPNAIINHGNISRSSVEASAPGLPGKSGFDIYGQGKGFLPAVSRFIGNQATPSALLELAALHGIGTGVAALAAPTVGGEALQAATRTGLNTYFGAQALPGAAQRMRNGDIVGGLTEAALGGLPLTAEIIGDYAHSNGYRLPPNGGEGQTPPLALPAPDSGFVVDAAGRIKPAADMGAQPNPDNWMPHTPNEPADIGAPATFTPGPMRGRAIPPVPVPHNPVTAGLDFGEGDTGFGKTSPVNPRLTNVDTNPAHRIDSGPLTGLVLDVDGNLHQGLPLDPDTASRMQGIDTGETLALPAPVNVPRPTPTPAVGGEGGTYAPPTVEESQNKLSTLDAEQVALRGQLNTGFVVNANGEVVPGGPTAPAPVAATPVAPVRTRGGRRVATVPAAQQEATAVDTTTPAPDPFANDVPVPTPDVPPIDGGETAPVLRSQQHGFRTGTRVTINGSPEIGDGTVRSVRNGVAMVEVNGESQQYPVTGLTKVAPTPGKRVAKAQTQPVYDNTKPVNGLPPQNIVDRYMELTNKERNGGLTPDENGELVDLHDTYPKLYDEWSRLESLNGNGEYLGTTSSVSLRDRGGQEKVTDGDLVTKGMTPDQRQYAQRALSAIGNRNFVPAELANELEMADPEVKQYIDSIRESKNRNRKNKLKPIFDEDGNISDEMGYGGGTAREVTPIGGESGPRPTVTQLSRRALADRSAGVPYANMPDDALARMIGSPYLSGRHHKAVLDELESRNHGSGAAAVTANVTPDKLRGMSDEQLLGIGTHPAAEGIGDAVKAELNRRAEESAARAYDMTNEPGNEDAQVPPPGPKKRKPKFRPLEDPAAEEMAQTIAAGRGDTIIDRINRVAAANMAMWKKIEARAKQIADATRLNAGGTLNAGTPIHLAYAYAKALVHYGAEGVAGFSRGAVRVGSAIHSLALKIVSGELLRPRDRMEYAEREFPEYGDRTSREMLQLVDNAGELAGEMVQGVVGDDLPPDTATPSDWFRYHYPNLTTDQITEAIAESTDRIDPMHLSLGHDDPAVEEAVSQFAEAHRNDYDRHGMHSWHYAPDTEDSPHNAFMDAHTNVTPIGGNEHDDPQRAQFIQDLGHMGEANTRVARAYYDARHEGLDHSDAVMQANRTTGQQTMWHFDDEMERVFDTTGGVVHAAQAPTLIGGNSPATGPTPEAQQANLTGHFEEELTRRAAQAVGDHAALANVTNASFSALFADNLRRGDSSSEAASSAGSQVPGAYGGFIYALIDSATEMQREGYDFTAKPDTGSMVRSGGTGQEFGRPNNLGFYSRLERVIDSMPFGRNGLPVSQLSVASLKQKGIKDAELESTGLQDFLKDKQTVTKQELTDWLAANRQDFQVKVSPPGTSFGKMADFRSYWPNDERLGGYDGLQGEARDNYQEHLIIDPKHPEYEVPHWHEGGIAAHLRTTFVTDSQGRKVMVVGEAQSDPHQAVKGQNGTGGYYLTALPEGQKLVPSRREHFTNVVDADGNILGTYRGNEQDAYRQLALDSGTISRDAHSTNRTPAPPDSLLFKSNWREVLARQAIKHAIDNGADAIAVIPGEHNADMYSKSGSEKMGMVSHYMDFAKALDKEAKSHGLSVQMAESPYKGLPHEYIPDTEYTKEQVQAGLESLRNNPTRNADYTLTTHPITHENVDALSINEDEAGKTLEAVGGYMQKGLPFAHAVNNYITEGGSTANLDTAKALFGGDIAKNMDLRGDYRGNTFTPEQIDSATNKALDVIASDRYDTNMDTSPLTGEVYADPPQARYVRRWLENVQSAMRDDGMPFSQAIRDEYKYVRDVDRPQFLNTFGVKDEDLTGIPYKHPDDWLKRRHVLNLTDTETGEPLPGAQKIRDNGQPLYKTDIPEPGTTDPMDTRSRVSAMRDAAQARIDERNARGEGNLYTAPVSNKFVENAQDYAIIGASHIMDGAMDFAQFSARMMRQFGREIGPHLSDIYAKANDIISRYQSGNDTGDFGRAQAQQTARNTPPPPIGGTPAPAQSKVGQLLGKIGDTLKGNEDLNSWGFNFNPESRSPEAGRSARIKRAYEGEADRENAKVIRSVQEGRKAVAGLRTEQLRAMMNEMEQGDYTHSNPKIQMAKEQYRAAVDTMTARVKALAPDALPEFLDNYVARVRKMPNGKIEIQYPHDINPNPAPKGFRSKRSYESIMDVPEGYQFVTDNPFDMLAFRAAEANKFIRTRQIVQAHIADGMMKVLPHGLPKEGVIPEGWRQVDPSLARTLPDGMNQNYYAPEPVAAVMENWLSPGLRGSKYLKTAFKMVSGLNNTLNMAKLGLSGVHALTMTTLSTESKLASAFMNMEDLNFKGAGRNVAEAIPAVGFNVARGRQVAEDYANPQGDTPPIGVRIANRAKVASGASYGNYRESLIGGHEIINPHQRVEQLRRDFRNNGAAGKRVGQVADVVNMGANYARIAGNNLDLGVMSHLVPAVKEGAMYDLANTEYNRLLKRYGSDADIPEDEFRRVMSRAADSVDNRFGQVNYKNIFMNQRWKDAFFSGLRAPGWQLTYREMIGGMKDITQAPFKGTTRNTEIRAGDRILTPRAAALLAKVITNAAIGATVTYFVGHHKPEGEDFAAPRINDHDRIMTPDQREQSNLVDMMTKAAQGSVGPAIGDVASGKLSEATGVAGDFFTGNDHFGKPNLPSDTLPGRLSDIPSYAGRKMVPISVTQGQRAMNIQRPSDIIPAIQQDPGAAVRSFIGLNPPPKRLNSEPQGKRRVGKRVGRIRM